MHLEQYTPLAHKFLGYLNRNDVDKDNDAVKSAAIMFLKTQGIRPRKLTSGFYRAAIILPKAVLKVAIQEESEERMQAEVEYIWKMRSNPRFRRYFPETTLVVAKKRGTFNYCIVQAAVGGVKKPSPWDMTRVQKLRHKRAEHLAYSCGIGDLHEDNYGFGGKKRKYPIFIDCEFNPDSPRDESYGNSDWGSSWVPSIRETS